MSTSNSGSGILSSLIDNFTYRRSCVVSRVRAAGQEKRACDDDVDDDVRAMMTLNGDFWGVTYVEHENISSETGH